MGASEDYHRKEAVIELVIDNLPSAIVVLDYDTSIVLANRLAEQFSQQSKHHLIGLRGGIAFNCIHADEHPLGCGYSLSCESCVVRNTVEESIRTGTGMSGVEAPMTFRHTGGRLLSVSTTVLAEHELVIVALNDITVQKEHESMRCENAKLAAAMKTGGAICHELNQPLMVIAGYFDLLSMKNGNRSFDDDTFDEIQRQISRLKEISRKLAGITKYREVKYLSGTILDIEESSLSA